MSRGVKRLFFTKNASPLPMKAIETENLQIECFGTTQSMFYLTNIVTSSDLSVVLLNIPFDYIHRSIGGAL